MSFLLRGGGGSKSSPAKPRLKKPHPKKMLPWATGGRLLWLQEGRRIGASCSVDVSSPLLSVTQKDQLGINTGLYLAVTKENSVYRVCKGMESWALPLCPRRGWFFYYSIPSFGDLSFLGLLGLSNPFGLNNYLLGLRPLLCRSYGCQLLGVSCLLTNPLLSKDLLYLEVF